MGLSLLSFVVPPPANPLFSRWKPQKEISRDIEADTVQMNRTWDQEPGPLLLPRSTMAGEIIRTEDAIIPRAHGPETITVRVEFGHNEKKTIKEIIHADGSRTITTTIEDLYDDVDLEDESTVDSGENAMDDISFATELDAPSERIVL